MSTPNRWEAFEQKFVLKGMDLIRPWGQSEPGFWRMLMNVVPFKEGSLTGRPPLKPIPGSPLYPAPDIYNVEWDGVDYICAFEPDNHGEHKLLYFGSIHEMDNYGRRRGMGIGSWVIASPFGSRDRSWVYLFGQNHVAGGIERDRSEHTYVIPVKVSEEGETHPVGLPAPIIKSTYVQSGRTYMHPLHLLQPWLQEAAALGTMRLITPSNADPAPDTYEVFGFARTTPDPEDTINVKKPTVHNEAGHVKVLEMRLEDAGDQTAYFRKYFQVPINLDSGFSEDSLVEMYFSQARVQDVTSVELRLLLDAGPAGIYGHIPGHLTVTPAQHHFKDVGTGEVSAVKTFRVTSDGRGSVLVDDLIPTDGDFEIVDDHVTGQLLKRGTSATFGVQLRGVGQPRDHTALIQVNSDVGTEEIRVNGIVVGKPDPQDITVVPDHLDFGHVTEGESSAETTVTVTNNGAIAFRVNGLQFIQPTGDFTIAAISQQLLQQGESATIAVTFTPTSIGAKTGMFEIDANNSGASKTVNYEGVGDVFVPPKQADFKFEPTTYDFGDVKAGQEPPVELGVTFENNGPTTPAGRVETPAEIVRKDVSQFEPVVQQALMPGWPSSISLRIHPPRDAPLGPHTGIIKFICRGLTIPDITYSVNVLAGDPETITLDPIVFVANNLSINDKTSPVLYKVTNTGGTGVVTVNVIELPRNMVVSEDHVTGVPLADGASATFRLQAIGSFGTVDGEKVRLHLSDGKVIEMLVRVIVVAAEPPPPAPPDWVPDYADDPAPPPDPVSPVPVIGPPVVGITDLSGSALSSTEIRLDWSEDSQEPELIDGYSLQWSLSPTAFYNSVHLGPSTFQHVFQDMTPATTYYFRILTHWTGTSGASGMAFSNPAMVTTAAATGAVPGDPTGLQATAISYSQVRLTWTLADNNASYIRIFKRLASSAVPAPQVGNALGTDTSFDDHGVLASTTYEYWIQTWNSSGESAQVGPVTVTTPAEPPPDGGGPDRPTVPVLTGTLDGLNSVDLLWTHDGVNTAEYWIYRQHHPEDFTYTRIGIVPASTKAWLDHSLAAGTWRYYVMAVSVDAAQWSDNSNVVELEVSEAADPLETPELLEVTESGGARLVWKHHDVRVQWTQIYKVDSAGDSHVLHATLGDSDPLTTTWTDTSAIAGEESCYVVASLAAIDGWQVSSLPSNELCITLGGGTPPTGPTDLQSTGNTDRTIDLTWTDNTSGETHFELRRSYVGTVWSNILTVPQNATTYTDTGLSPGAAYGYVIRAIAADGTPSGWSNYVQVSTAADTGAPPAGVPIAPESLQAYPDSATSIRLTWVDRSSDETGFKVEHSLDGQTGWTELETVAAEVTHYTHHGLTEDVVHYYRVRAVNATGESAPTSVASAIIGGVGRDPVNYFYRVFEPVHYNFENAPDAGKAKTLEELLGEYERQWEERYGTEWRDITTAVTPYEWEQRHEAYERGRQRVIESYQSAEAAYNDEGIFQWDVFSEKRRVFLRMGTDITKTWGQVTGVEIRVNYRAAAALDDPFRIHELWMVKGHSDLDSLVGLPYDWRYTYYNSLTGVEGNPSPMMPEAVEVERSPAYFNIAADPALRGVITHIRLYRRGGTLRNYHMVSEIPYIDDLQGVITYVDTKSDLAIVGSRILEYDNDQAVVTSARRTNWWTWSHDISEMGPHKSNVVLTSYDEKAPDGSVGGSTAVVTANSGAFWVDVNVEKKDHIYSLSFYAKMTKGVFKVKASFENQSGVTMSEAYCLLRHPSEGYPHGTWTRFHLLGASDKSQARCRIRLDIEDAVSGETLALWGFQLIEADSSGVPPVVLLPTRGTSHEANIPDTGFMPRRVFGPFQGKYLFGVSPAHWGPSAITGKFEDARFRMGNALFWTKAHKPDSWPAANYLLVGGIGDPLVNGCIYNRRPYLFSRTRMYVVDPNPGGQTTFIVQETAVKEGLASPHGLAVGPASIFFISRSGIMETNGGSAKNLSEDSLIRPIFEGDKTYIEGYEIYPVDWDRPMHLAVARDYLYFWFEVEKEVSPGETSVQYQCLRYYIPLARWEGFWDVQSQLSSEDHFDLWRASFYDHWSASLLVADQKGHIGEFPMELPENLDYSAEAAPPGFFAVTPFFDMGSETKEKLFGQILIEAASKTVGSSILIYYNINHLEPLDPISSIHWKALGELIFDGSGKQHFVLDLNGGRGIRGRSISLAFLSGDLTSEISLEQMEISYRVEETRRRWMTTDWEDLGTPHDKWTWGASLDVSLMDDGPQLVEFLISGDGAIHHVESVMLHPDRQVVEISWPVLRASQIRLQQFSHPEIVLHGLDWYSTTDEKDISKWYSNWETTPAGKDGYVWGLELDIDTKGQLKEIRISAEGDRVVATLPVVANGRKKVRVTFPRAERDSSLKFEAVDDSPGYLYGHSWLHTGMEEAPRLDFFDSNWQPAGPGQDFYVWALELDIDTEGLPVTIEVYKDGSDSAFHAPWATVVAQGRQKIRLDFPAVQATDLRFVMLHGGDKKARIWEWMWMASPEPPKLHHWDSNHENDGSLEDKWISGLYLEMDSDGVDKLFDIYVDGKLIGTYPAVSAGRGLSRISFGPVRGVMMRYVAHDNPSLPDHPARIYEHRWIWEQEPVKLTNLATNWDNLGWPYEKLVKGFAIEADTHGQPKTLQLRTDGDPNAIPLDIKGQPVGAITVNFNGRDGNEYSFPNMVRLHTLRMDPTDGNLGRLYTLRWIFDNEPPELQTWFTQEHNFDIKDYLFLLDLQISIRSVTDVTLRVEIDTDRTVEYLIGSTGGERLRRLVNFQALKGKSFKFTLTAPLGFYIYNPSSEVTVRPFRGGEERTHKLPFLGAPENP